MKIFVGFVLAVQANVITSSDPRSDCQAACNDKHHEDKLKCDEISNHQEHNQCIKDANNAHHDCNDRCHCIDHCDHRYVTELHKCDVSNEL